MDGVWTSGPEWVLPIIGRSIDRVMSRKEAALLMGIDQSQLTRQLSGRPGCGHLSTLRLGALPPPFWAAFTAEIRIHFGISTRAEVRAQAEHHLEQARQLFALAEGL